MAGPSDLLAHVCYHYNERDLTREQFIEVVDGLLMPLDALVSSITRTIVEVTVRAHFCEWWIECEEQCIYLRDRDRRLPWCEDDPWSPLRWQDPCQGQSDLDYSKSRRMTVRDARERVTARVKQKIFARDGHKCVACGSGPPLEVDHIIPVSLGGSGDETNLQSLCRPCNRRKGSGSNRRVAHR